LEELDPTRTRHPMVKMYLLAATKKNMHQILQLLKQQNDTTGGGTVTFNMVQIVVSVRRIQRNLSHKDVNAELPKEVSPELHMMRLMIEVESKN
jgi:hypothetical protein